MATAAPAPAGHKKRKHTHKQFKSLEPLPSLPPSDEPAQAQQQDVPAAAASLGSGNSAFARALGSTDYQTRERGLQSLSRWLVHRPAISELDMRKLWKGLFFCFWHSDKEPVQEELAERLARLLVQLQPDTARLYWAAMLACLRAEWFAMDRHRLNKFLMLVRKFVAALFTRLAQGGWRLEAIAAFTGPLPLGQALVPLADTRSLGLSYHLADVWLRELARVAGAPGAAPLPGPALEALLAPFAAALQGCSEAPLVKRIRESVFDVLLEDLAAAADHAAGGSSDSSDGDVDGSAAWAYCAQLDAPALAARLFELGAAAGVRARNREALYSLSRELERAAGKRRSTGGAGAPPAMQKPQKQHKQRAAAKPAAAVEQGEDAAAARAHATPGKRKKQQQPEAEPAPQPQSQQPEPNGVPPSSSKKRKQQQQQQPVPAEVQPQPAQQPQQAAAATPGSAASGKKHKKKHRSSSGATPGSPVAGAAPAAATGKPRGVRINLRHNVVFEHGAPVPPPDIRTPPNAKPKGSALKAQAGGAVAPATAPAAARPGGRKAATPSSVPRIKAAAFF